jgi:hypothetical protein
VFNRVCVAPCGFGKWSIVEQLFCTPLILHSQTVPE